MIGATKGTVVLSPLQEKEQNRPVTQKACHMPVSPKSWPHPGWEEHFAYNFSYSGNKISKKAFNQVFLHIFQAGFSNSKI